MVENIIKVNDENFDNEVLEKSKKISVVVDFWGSWCGPCLTLLPIMEKLAKEYEGKLILAKANIDENQKHAQKYGVMGIPNVKFFKNGKIVDEFTGAIPEQQIKEWILKNL